MMHITIYCDICGKDCTNTYIGLNAYQYIQGTKPKHSNRMIELCVDCFYSTLNKNMDLEFVDEYDDIGGEYY